MSHQNHSGFTLIELCMTGAAAALLFGMLLPMQDRFANANATTVCLSHLRAIGAGAYMYAENNADFLPRGIMDVGRGEYNTFVTAVLPYTGFEGDPLSLWDGNGNAPGSGGRPSPAQQHRLRNVLRDVGEVWQCPEFPDAEHDASRNVGEHTQELNGRPIDTSLLDYVASEFPLPYSQSNTEYDLLFDAPPDPNAAWQGVGVGTVAIVSMSRLDDIAMFKDPAETIYVSEAHVQLKWDDFTFHHAFVMAQIPFGVQPRLANDQRHQGRMNAMFFDGHARGMRLHRMDAGWPNTLETRLRWFTAILP